jgi:endonuclease YncB( thermonuclease family)
LLAVLLAIIVMAMYLGFSGMGMPDRSMLGARGSQNDVLAATFPICGVGRRITCVVDGDTFWLDGVKIRIADIDAPELSPARCEAERLKGEAAKSRLQRLLNA